LTGGDVGPAHCVATAGHNVSQTWVLDPPLTEVVASDCSYYDTSGLAPALTASSPVGQGCAGSTLVLLIGRCCWPVSPETISAWQRVRGFGQRQRSC